MPKPGKEWTDKDILEVLHLRDHAKLPASSVADRFGVTRNAILGLVTRVKDGVDKSDPDGNQNGTMAPRWWVR